MQGEPLVIDVKQGVYSEHGDFVVGPTLTQEELLRRRSEMNDAGTIHGEEREAREEATEERELRFIPDEIAEPSIKWTAADQAFIADDSPYRNLWDPNSKYHECWNKMTPAEQQEMTQLSEESKQKEDAVVASAEQATNSRPAADAVLDAEIAKTTEAIAGADKVVKYGEPEDAAISAKAAARGRETNAYNRETQRLMREAKTPAEKEAILLQRSPQYAQHMDEIQAKVLQRKGGASPVASVLPDPTPTTSAPATSTPITSPAPAPAAPVVVSPVVAQPPVASAPAAAPPATTDPAITDTAAPTATTEFNNAATGATAPLPASPTLATDAGSFYLENRTLFDYSMDDNLDDPDSKYNGSLWYALDNNPDLVTAYDDAVDKQEAACDAADATLSADNFLAEREAIIDRKLAVNEIAAFDYSGHNRTEEIAQAQAERTKLLEEQKKLADLKTQMEGKTEPEKAELLRAAFPPDAKAGQKTGIFEQYMAGKPEEPAAPDATAAADEECCADDGDYFDEWIMSGDWYDTGSACSIYDLPGGIAPACTITPTFMLAANAPPSTTADPTAEATGGTTLVSKPPALA